MSDKKMKELEQLCKPVAEYLKKNWDPYCTAIITDTHIRLVRDEIGIPVGTAQEVPVQEQSSQDKNNGLLALLITTNSLISKAIDVLNNTNAQ